MVKFLDSEKPRQADFKAISHTFSEAAREDGYFATKFRPYCLPSTHAEENLIPEIRQIILSYFAKEKIKWHQGHNGKPSNHMCDSQVCCVNFLFPFADKPLALKTLLQRIYPDIHIMLPLENGQYVAYEWIGAEDYLNEKADANNKTRSRGANCTSADAVVMFQREDKKQQIVLIEWKYTESYSGGKGTRYAESRKDRMTIYQGFYEERDSPLDKTLLPHFDALFYNPFDQLMRQQFLAHEMEKARELGANVVSLLHIAPAHNVKFRRVTSKKLIPLGNTAMDVWQRIAPPDRFKSISTEALFGHLSVNELPDMATWLDYIHERYSWIRQPLPTVERN